MAIRTDSDSRYYRRFLIIGIVALGWAVFCLYDGFIRYPNQRERGLAYQKLETELEGGDPIVFRDRWEELARQNNWPTTYPGEPKSEADITLQFVMAAGSGAIGLWLLWGVWRARGQWIEQTETGLTSSWGQKLEYDQVLAVDKRKWRNKGIAKIRYQDGPRKRRFVLDNFKFDRDTTDRILYELESRIGHDKIMGGPPEAASYEQSAHAAEPSAAEPARPE